MASSVAKHIRKLKSVEDVNNFRVEGSTVRMDVHTIEGGIITLSFEQTQWPSKWVSEQERRRKRWLGEED